MSYKLDKIVEMAPEKLNYTLILDEDTIYKIKDISGLEGEACYNNLYKLLDYTNKTIVKKLNYISRLKNKENFNRVLAEAREFFNNLENIGIFKNFKARDLNNEFLKKIVDYDIYFKFLDLLSYIYDSYINFRDLLYPNEFFTNSLDFNFRDI